MNYDDLFLTTPEDVKWSAEKMKQLRTDIENQYPNVDLAEHYLEANYTLVVPFRNENKGILVLKTDYSFEIISLPEKFWEETIEQP